MNKLNLFIDPDSALWKVNMKFSVINHQLLLHCLPSTTLCSLLFLQLMKMFIGNLLQSIVCILAAVWGFYK